MLDKIKKVIRFIGIYGFQRTLIKSVGRLRINYGLRFLITLPRFRNSDKKIAIIGCGHHSFSSIVFFLFKNTNSKIIWVYDIDKKASSFLASFYNIPKYLDNLDFKTIEKQDIPDIVYIASNHKTHVDYAISFIKLGCDVFIEKPIAINICQLRLLSQEVKNSNVKVYGGYNRPFSKSFLELKNLIYDYSEPFTLSCFIIGHWIDDDHWYRDPSEGSRIVSNLGHWIDLSVFIYSINSSYPKFLDITISSSNLKKPSENLSISMISSNKDLITLTFSARGEPYEGVSEIINFQQKELIFKIDDFRETKIWISSKYKKRKYWPKDNGHKNAILQPFSNKIEREWSELELSTRLMLHIENMIQLEQNKSRFKFNETDTTKSS